MKKGFTLIELLVVIAIVAILAVVVILTLNPAELIKQARDSTRVADINTLKAALSYYSADRLTPVLAEPYTACYTSNNSTVSSGCGGAFAGYAATNYSSNLATVDGTGWVGKGSGNGPNLTSITTGSPIGQLPLDPTNNGSYYYAYVASSTNNYFEIDSILESSKFAVTSSTNLQIRDGGSNANVYETGSYLFF